MLASLCLVYVSRQVFQDLKMVVFSGVDSESVGCLLLLSLCPSDRVSEMIITC